MEITLSWDLLVIVFFAIVVAYSFIVGKDESAKIIISSYIAIVAVQGIGNLLATLFIDSATLADLLGVGMDRNIIAIIKLVLFTAAIIFLSIRGGFQMDYNQDIGGIWDTVLTGLFGFSTAGLLLSALVTFVAARPILDEGLGSAPFLDSILSQSTLVQVMVDYQDVWFCVPAILLLVAGFLSNRE